MGLAARSHPEESLHAEARALARALTELPDAALVTTKRLLRAGTAGVAREALGRERAAARALHDRLGPLGYKD